MIKYLQATKMQMSGSLCRDSVPVTTEDSYKGEYEEERPTEKQKTAEERHISFVTQKVDKTKEINDWAQVLFLLV